MVELVGEVEVGFEVGLVVELELELADHVEGLVDLVEVRDEPGDGDGDVQALELELVLEG